MFQRLPIPLLVLFAMWIPGASAQPQSGFSLMVGGAYHDSTFESDEAGSRGNTIDLTSVGWSAGVDYQWAFSDTMSLNPFFQGSSEQADDEDEIYDSSSHAILGVQWRYWLDDLFAGVHVGRYSEALVSEEDTTGGSGWGFGIAGGTEFENGGYVIAQLDRATIEYSNGESDLTGVRVHVGFRFK